MKRKKLLKTLAGFFDQEKRKKRKHREELEVLLKQLETKEIALQEKALQEKNQRKRERLGKELDIIRAQRSKGLQVLSDMLES